MDARYSIVPRYTLARPEKAYVWAINGQNTISGLPSALEPD